MPNKRRLFPWALLLAIVFSSPFGFALAGEFSLDSFPIADPFEQKFREARALEVKGDSGAVAAYRALLVDDFAASDAVHAAMARLLTAEKAASHWQAVLDFKPASPFTAEALEGLAGIRETQGRLVEVETLLQLLTRSTTDEEVAAGALLRVAELLDRQGKREQLLPVAEEIWVEFAHLPESRRAGAYLAGFSGDPFRPVRGERIFERGRVLLDKGRRDEAVRTLAKLRQRLIPNSRIEPDVDLALGKALYFLRRYDEALAPLDRARRHSQTEEEARFYRARSLFGLNRGDEGAADLVALARKFPKSRKATSYLYQAYRVFEGRKMWNEAKKARETLRKRYPESQLTLESRWNEGWRAFKQGRHADAVPAFRASAGESGKGWLRARGLYWEGRALLAVGREKEGRGVFENLVVEFPLGYYTRLAGYLLASGKPALGLGDPRQSSAQALSVGLPGPGDLTPEGEAARPAQYLRLGLREAAYAVLREKRRSGLVWARLAYWSEDFNGAIAAAGRSWIDWPTGEAPGLLTLSGLGYPVAYPRSATAAARAAGIHPHLLLAVAHTESHFDPMGYSSWEARGLMQFIPATGATVAKSAGLEGFEPEDLYDPQIALNLGARHLRELLDRFDGDLVAAVAAYNAGPGAVERWLKGAGKPDVDFFVESIPYRETRRYVKKVVTAMDAYGRLDPPGLQSKEPP